jgi:hypothetical protein
VKCRNALVQCQVRGELDSMESMAEKAEVSRSTASRFFSGKPTSLAVTLVLLDILGVPFADVAMPLSEEEALKAVAALAAEKEAWESRHKASGTKDAA